jgi:hypothetical protein
MLDYGEFVDGGRPPSSSGSEPGKLQPKIVKWLSYPNVRDKIRGGKSDAPIDDIEGLAFIIARKIHEKGTDPSYFLQDVLDGPIPKRLLEDLENSIFEDLDLLLTEVLDQIPEGNN